MSSVEPGINFAGDNPVVTLTTGEPWLVDVPLKNDYTKQFEAGLQEEFSDKINRKLNPDTAKEYYYSVNDNFFKALADVLDENDIDERNKQLAALYNWMKDPDIGLDKDSREIYLNVIEQTSKVPFPSGWSFFHIYDLLWKAWDRPGGESYIDKNVNVSDFGLSNNHDSQTLDYFKSLNLAWQGHDVYLNIGEESKVSKESPQQYTYSDQTSLPGDINQKGYGSCAALSFIDSLLRKPDGSGLSYLQSLVVPTGSVDGANTYNVTLYDDNGNPVVFPVTIGETVYDKNWEKIAWFSNEGPNQSIAPEFIQAIELAYMKMRRDYTDVSDDGHINFIPPFVNHNSWACFVPDIPQGASSITQPSEAILNLLSQDGYLSCVQFSIPDDIKSIRVHGFHIKSDTHEYSIQVDDNGMVNIRDPRDTQTVLKLTYDEFLALNPTLYMSYSQKLTDYQTEYRNEQHKTSSPPTLTDAESPTPVAFGAKIPQIRQM